MVIPFRALNRDGSQAIAIGGDLLKRIRKSGKKAIGFSGRQDQVCGAHVEIEMPIVIEAHLSVIYRFINLG